MKALTRERIAECEEVATSLEPTAARAYVATLLENGERAVAAAPGNAFAHATLAQARAAEAALNRLAVRP